MNFTNLPDSINKIILVLSVVIIYFSISGIITNYSSIDTHYKDYLNSLDSNQRSVIELDFVIRNMLEQSKNISNKYNVDNYIVHHDSLIRFTQKYHVGKNEDIARDILTPVWDNYLIKSNEIKLQKITVERRLKEYNRKTEEAKYNIIGLFIVIAVSILAFLLCASQIEQERKSKEKGDGYLLRDKGVVSPWCQSCGRRFTAIVIAGSNSDGTTNYSFCKECYVDGEFTKDDETAYKEAIEAVKNVEIEMPYFNRKIVLKRVKNLDRWKKDNY